jgi:Raf kinase inhibitor-like YbhB/YbcL family protein
MRITFLFLALTIVTGACSPTPAPSPTAAPTEPGVTAEAWTLSSPVFKAGGPIPTKYGCTGQSISPALNWSNPPAGTQSLALILHDPDAPGGDFVHWVIYHIAPASGGLNEGVTTISQLPDGTLQGRNGAASTGYVGPCPPSGTHHYIFTMYALDDALDNLLPGADEDHLLQAMDGHILAQAELIGTFAK